MGPPLFKHKHTPNLNIGRNKIELLLETLILFFVFLILHIPLEVTLNMTTLYGQPCEVHF